MIKHWKKIMVSGMAVVLVGVGGSMVYGAQTQQKVANVKTSQIKISQAKAVATFSQTFGDKQIEQIELEPTRSGYVYTVEGFDDATEYSVKINAKTGKVVAQETDSKDADDANDLEFALNTDGIISRKEASKIAKTEATSGKARAWTLDQTSNNTAVWEVKVIDGTLETEVTINATTGDVLNTDVEDEAYDD